MSGDVPPTTDTLVKRTDLPSWIALQAMAVKSKRYNISEMFATDPDRFKRFHAEIDGMLIDYSKQCVDEDIMQALFALAEDCDLENWRDKLFRGEKINNSENRAVLHTALRSPAYEAVQVDGQNVQPVIHGALAKVKAFCSEIEESKEFEHVVNIGIGGSDLGPHMTYEALKPFSNRDIDMHFVSNVDASHLAETLRVCDPEKTLFIVTSKTFTTQETMTNAGSARAWITEQLSKEDVSKHFAAVSSNVEGAKDFGVAEDRIFPMWDWVGGRYSMWSAVGLPLAIGLGFENFQSILAGGHAMDRHFRTADLSENIPVLLALTGVWNRTFLGHEMVALLPYSQYLHKFPSFIQQLDMESNGKSVDRNGAPVDYQTGPIVFGEAGTNGQHAFYQLLHQGQTVVPSEFIAVIKGENDLADHQEKLLSNVLGQSKAMMDGKKDADLQKSFEGNRPSTTIVLDQLDPYTLGMLVALYEHKVFVQGVIWNLNSFDQWGVELGKKIAGQVLAYLDENEGEDKPVTGELDSSTAALIDRIRRKK